MKILIVGGGIGGLTLAAFLKQKNISCEIVEKAPDWSHLGYSIGIWNNGRSILKKLGLAHKLDELGRAESAYYLATGKGKLMKLYHFEGFHKKFWPAYTHIHRADLHNLLLEAASAATPIRMGISPKSIEQKIGNVKVTFNDNSVGTYDLVVGADGLHSQVRDMCFTGNFVHYTGWRTYFFWVEKDFKIPKGIFEMVEPGQFCAIFNERGNRYLAVLAMPAAHDVWDKAEDRLERIRAHFKNCGWLLPEILASVKAEDITPTDIAFVKMNNWISGRVLLLGDSAHAMEPFAGMGGSMAMEDAFVLADELGKVGAAEIPRALAKYQERRFKRVELARTQTRAMWWWATLTTRLFCFFRNLFAPYFPISHFTKNYKKLLNEEV